MRPGVLFAGALALFAVLGLLAGRPSSAPERPEPHRAVAPAQSREANLQPAVLARRWGAAFAAWTHRSLADQLDELAGSATPPLAAEVRRGADAIRRDRALVRDGAGSRGSVEAIRVRGAGPRRQLLVVTRELPYVASGSDLQGARYRVYEGRVVQDGVHGWRMESWERQP